jgi:2-hydroxy-3-keto-5-methylthiopentenyl-1-phosphate phosphatase
LFNNIILNKCLGNFITKKGQVNMNIAVLSDFDGTIITIDSCEFILANFANSEWQIYDQKYRENEISLEEAMGKQFNLIKTSEERILNKLDEVVSFRPYFNEMVNLCQNEGIPFVIVSAGLDFVIKHFLEIQKLNKIIKVVSASTTVEDSGISLSFPELRDNMSINFKDDLVKRFQNEGFLVTYLGDGSSDLPAARLADLTFAVKDSYLAQTLRLEGESCFEFTNFQEIINEIQWLIY